MIAVDSSALLAILFGEVEAIEFNQVLARSRPCVISAVSLLEVSMVVAGRHGDEALAELDLLLAKAAVEIVPFDAFPAGLARKAFLEYGKGRHKAQLNMGDCASYALARSRGLPLLFKGDDFTWTDLARAA